MQSEVSCPCWDRAGVAGDRLAMWPHPLLCEAVTLVWQGLVCSYAVGFSGFLSSLNTRATSAGIRDDEVLGQPH